MLRLFQRDLAGSESTGVCGRREILRLGGLATLGISLPQWLNRSAHAKQTTAEPPKLAGGGKARGVILVYLFGGPSQLETFDLKPEAPEDFRGEFKPIATTIPGISICEHFPLLAGQADKFALIRSMHHEHPRHGWGLYHMFTGRKHSRPDLDAPPTPDDHPGLGAMVAYALKNDRGLPPAVTLPRWNKFNDLPDIYAGERAGFLGKAYDPWLVNGNPQNLEFDTDGLNLPAGVTFDRLAERRQLLTSLDRELAALADRAEGVRHDVLFSQAMALITSPPARAAFDLNQEPGVLRDRYGRHPFGQGCLLARRLIEAGTALVTVNWHNDGSDVKSPFWDTHRDNFSSLKTRLMPPTDQGLSALLEDLAGRGLLDSTLVVVMGEFGRTPRIGRIVMNSATDATGRDHWPHAYSVLMAGGGIRGGQVYGASDDRGAYVERDPVTPPQLVSTILWALGINGSHEISDRLGRPQTLAADFPVTGLF